MGLNRIKQRLYTKMTEMDPYRQHPWRSILLLGTMMLLSLVAMVCRQAFTNFMDKLMHTNSKSNSQLWTQFSIAVIEGIMVVGCIRFKSSKPERSLREAIVIFGIAHVGSVMVQSYSTMFKQREHSTFSAFSYYEPVIAASVVFVSTRKTVTYSTIIALITSSLFAGWMTLSLRFTLSFTGTMLLALLATICVSVRNVCCYHIRQEPDVSIVVRSKAFMVALAMAGVCVVLLCTVEFGIQWLLPAVCAVGACGASVASTYIVTNILLHISVTSIALLNMWVNVLFNIIFMSSDFRPEATVTVLCLMVVVVTHMVYLKVQLETSGSLTSYKSVSTEEVYTRLIFLLFSTSVGTLIMYGLKPSFSQRDLNTLSYVGLDRVFRHLLQVQPDNTNYSAS